MKHFKIKSLVILALTCYQHFQTQILDFSEAEYGITAGINYSKIQHAHNPSSARTSFLAGVFSQIPLSQNYCGWKNQHYLHVQLEYSQTGEKGDKQTLYADNYLSLLLLYEFTWKYNPSNHIFLSAGPKFSALVSQDVKNAPPDRPYQINEDGKANAYDIGIVAMGGFKFYNNKIALYLRGDYSFSDRYPNLNEYPSTGDPLAAKRKVQYGVAVGACYLIF